MSAPLPQYDACVIGGSIAGSAVALALRELGLTVAVIEREAAFRDRARGEGIHPWGMDEAEDLGLLPVLEDAGAHPLPIWQTYQDQKPLDPFLWADESARGHAEHGVFHPRLQETMLARAASQGAAIVRPGVLKGFDWTDRGVTVAFEDNGGQSALVARFVIGADGTHSRTRSLCGIGIERNPHHHWFAGVLIDHFAGDQEAAHAALVPGGRFFILPQGNGRARLYAGLMPDRAAPIQADRSGRALIGLVAAHLPDSVLAGAEPVGPQGIFSNADLWPEAGVADRVVLIGDAAGTNDPSVGNGISQAFRDVRELRDLIRAMGLTQDAFDSFANIRAQYYGTLREYAAWMAALWLEEGPDADSRRAQFRSARESDPDAGGFNTVTALGPRDLIADESGRMRFFGVMTGMPANPS
jgi:2-polyprenyl-6-methoxyphenol hydroxylase-like FAD-dependent oxidoreductase